MKNLKDEIRELNIKLKHLLNGFNVLDMEADRIVSEVMKFNERNLTSLIEQEREKAVRGFVAWNKSFTFDPENEGYDIQEALEAVHAYFEILDSRAEQFLSERNEQE